MSRHNHDRQHEGNSVSPLIDLVQRPPMVIAQPLNDIQMVCLMAVHLDGTPAERVRLAMEITAEAIACMANQGLQKLIAERVIPGET